MKEFDTTSIDKTIKSISEIIRMQNLPAKNYVDLVSAYADLLQVRNDIQLKIQKEELAEIKRQIKELKNEFRCHLPGSFTPCNCLYQYGNYGGSGGNA